MAVGLETRDLRSAAEIRAGVALYRHVLQLTGEDASVGPRLLAALRRNGGLVLGSFDGDTVVAFAYGFLGRDDDGRLHHYSQAAVVDPRYQGRGIGTALKQAQRARVLEQGVSVMRWAFDPLRTGNAHFNLNVLGAVGRWFERDLYGVESGGRDAGRRTDRLVVEWDLAAPTPPATTRSTPAPTEPRPSQRFGVVVRAGDAATLTLPLSRSDLAVPPGVGLAQLQDDVAAALESLLSDGYLATSCRAVDDRTAVYTFRRQP